MIQGISIAGDVFWILALAVMSSMSWATQKRIPAGTSVPVAWRGDQVLVRAPKWAALWLLIAVAFAIGGWMKVESRAPDLSLNGAWIWLGVRLTLAPLLATLHLSQIRKGLETLDREGRL
ncbi:hypothetical protein [Caulobacter sp. NIBR1757]|uniref:hypothetical protein n=1 Tax=Caulobacter sp. NIBR1757 TaxID=3016000 RepID=UPI0022F06EFD|nr:hypothetical protein [Caulobacter sp. NIBR1757]WGM37216.1 hypothetical protein AMEJIAPC_00110 [Caulobacter sp. NIBR1757]